VNVDGVVLGNVCQSVVGRCYREGIGYDCARVVFKERKEKLNHFEREATDESCTRT